MSRTTIELIVSILGGLVLLVGLLVRLLALGVVPRDKRPSTGMAWLLLVLLSPLIGAIAYSFFGRIDVGRRREQELREAHRRIARATRTLAVAEPAGISDQLRTLVDLNRTLGAMPLMSGNDLELLDDYATCVRRMTSAVDDATTHVHVEFYIMALDDLTSPFFDALERAAGRGVQVRLLYDHLGTRRIPGYRGLVRRLDRAQARYPDTFEYHPMLPLQPLRGRWRRPDLRNHRKILVVDDQIGFTGSLNLTEPSYNKPKNRRLGREWVELMVRTDGPLVAALDAVFLTDWFLETRDENLRPEPHHASPARPDEIDELRGIDCQVVPSGPGLDRENNLRLFNALIYAATDRLRIVSPYFVPDESLLYAVTTAAQRGVRVELYVSEESDQFLVGHAQCSYYDALLRAGVRILRYPAPKILHSKYFTVDDTVAVIGSSNLDMRSFSLNYEVSVMALGAPVVERLDVVTDHYLALSTELTEQEWSRRPWHSRYLDNVCRLTAALQ